MSAHIAHFRGRLLASRILGSYWFVIPLCFSEEKAKLMRRIGGMIDEKDQELITFMTSLQLDQLNIHSSSNRLPQVIS